MALGLVAHDRKKAILADWVGRHLDWVAAHTLICTGTTGARLQERWPHLTIERLASGPEGGDQQMGARIVAGEVASGTS